MASEEEVMMVVAPAALARIRPVMETPPVPVDVVSQVLVEKRTVCLTEEEHSLSWLQRNIAIQCVPRSCTGADQGTQLRKAEFGA